MTISLTAMVPVVYPANYCLKGDQQPRRDLLVWEHQPFAVRSIFDVDAPAAFSLQQEARRTLWRQFGEQLYVSVLTPQGLPATLADLETISDRQLLATDDENEDVWKDHPSFVDARHSIAYRHQARARQAVETHGDGRAFREWAEDERPAAMTHMARVMSKVIVVDDEIFRAGLEPLIQVSMNPRRNSVIRIATVTQPVFAPEAQAAAVYFRADQIDAARACAAAMAQDRHLFEAAFAEQATVVDNYVAPELDGWLLHDTGERACVEHAYRQLRRVLGGMRADIVPTATLLAFSLARAAAEGEYEDEQLMASTFAAIANIGDQGYPSQKMLSFMLRHREDAILHNPAPADVAPGLEGFNF